MKRHEWNPPTTSHARGDRGAVYGPRGIAHTSNDPVTDFQVLTKIGSDATAVENSAVDTADCARTYIDSFLGSSRAH